MARSQDRRPGFSRRAQYGIFTGYVVAFAGVLAGLAVLAISLFNPGAFSFARNAANEVARPLGQAGASSRQGGQGLFSAIGAYFDAGRQNAQLHREVDKARANAATMHALQDENRRLKALLGIIDPQQRPVAAARLIGSTASSTRRFAILSVGWRSGVRNGEPVRSETGLIGRVTETGPDTARVLLVTDADNVVPVRRASDGLAAFIQGGGNGQVTIRLLNLGVNPVRKGDVFVTSGSGGLYPPGIPVAVATQPMRDGAIAQLASDPAAAEFVIVDPVFQQAATQAMVEADKPVPPVQAPPRKKKK
ncbi:rod shape-determining protein MreC [Novosphingobium lentum]|uniref:rod shape-determining protein MreC n=1 Tax=Novosphingobium lentum TaxID=145287 RepID=UPI000833494A|nr:rod shape-determining protein MreC [Novosphingobium lentum]